MKSLLLILIMFVSSCGRDYVKIEKDIISNFSDKKLSDNQVNVIFILDYGCSSCHKLNKEIDQLLESNLELKEKINIDYMPISSYVGVSYGYSIASLCAKRINQFDVIHDLIMKDYNSYLNVDSYKKNILEKDRGKFEECYSNRDSIDDLKINNIKASSLPLTGTPIVIINNKAFQGYMSMEKLESNLLAALN